MRELIVITVIVFVLPLAVTAQFIDTIQEPPGIEWKKIDTPHFQVVFPEEITAEAQRAVVIDGFDIAIVQRAKRLGVPARLGHQLGIFAGRPRRLNTCLAELHTTGHDRLMRAAPQPLT